MEDIIHDRWTEFAGYVKEQDAFVKKHGSLGARSYIDLKLTWLHLKVKSWVAKIKAARAKRGFYTTQVAFHRSSQCSTANLFSCHKAYVQVSISRHRQETAGKAKAAHARQSPRSSATPEAY